MTFQDGLMAPVPGKKSLILVIDDSATHVAVVRQALESAGYDVAGMIAEFPTLTPEQIADALCWSLRPAKERERLTRATLHTDEGDEA